MSSSPAEPTTPAATEAQDYDFVGVILRALLEDMPDGDLDVATVAVLLARRRSERAWAALEPLVAALVAERERAVRERPTLTHADAISDTGDGYTLTRGWHIACLWCSWQTTASTKTDAIAEYRDHEQQALADDAERSMS